MIAFEVVKPNSWRRCVLVVVASLAVGLQAFQAVPLTVEQLTEKARFVLHGTVASKTVQRDPAGRIYTRLELQVTETWKGQTTNSFTVVQAGGVLGEEIASVEGQEEFTVGEEVVLFLILNQRHEGVVVGLTQGKFNVHAEAGGEKLVRNLFHGNPPNSGASVAANGKTSRLTLASLKQRVQGGRP